MKLAFRRNPSQPREPRFPMGMRDANPFIMLGRTYLLVDNTLHRTVNKAAEHVEDRRGWARSTTMGVTMVLGSIATAFSYADRPFLSACVLTINGSTAAYCYTRFKHWERRKSLSSSAQHFEYDLASKVRFPLLAFSFVLQNIFVASVSIALYLASSSNGMIDHIRQFGKDLVAWKNRVKGEIQAGLGKQKPQENEAGK